MWISRSPLNFIALKITQEFWVVSHLRGRNKFVKSLNVLKFITEIWYDMII